MCGLNESLTNISTELEATKKSVADGKSLIASAITNKGVTTAADATFQVMADNISAMADTQYNKEKEEAASQYKTVGWSLSYKDNEAPSATGTWNVGAGYTYVYVGCNGMKHPDKNSGSISSLYNKDSGIVSITYYGGAPWTYITASASGTIVCVK